MAQGRGSARPALVIGVAILCFMALAQPTLARVYTINWTYNVVSWPRGKSFRAGDTIVFKYPKGQHNVVPVSRGTYSSCSSPRGARIYNSGSDALTLRKGLNFFICTFPGHCGSGMKIAVNAA